MCIKEILGFNWFSRAEMVYMADCQVGWDESSASERPRRVSLWEIEPVSTPILICPPHFALRPKRPLHNGLVFKLLTVFQLKKLKIRSDNLDLIRITG